MDDFSTLFKDLKDLAVLPSMNSGSLLEPERLMLIQTWAALFGATNNRHAIGNLMGPLILAEGIKQRRGLSIPVGEDWVTRRFRSLIQTVGLVNHSETSDAPTNGKPLFHTEPQFTWPQNDVLGRYKKVYLTLLDDQYELGYHTILAHLFFGSQYDEQNVDGVREAKWRNDLRDIRVRSSSQPELLLRLVREALTGEPDWSQPRLLGQDEVDILCLDLRLFGDSRSDKPSSKEQDFLNELLQLCTTFNLPLSGNQKLAAAVESARRRAQGGAEELQALCLLPLLVNRVDPSLPIVLFSSTHQREVTDVFRDYPSIITTFAKPIITGYASSDLAGQCASDLEEAIFKGLELHRIRGVWKMIFQLAQSIGARAVNIEEKVLEPKENGTHSYTIDREVISTLVSEYQNLFLRGRFADSLQLPDNLLEYIGAKFETPRPLRNLDILFVNDLRDHGQPWEQALSRADWNQETRRTTRKLLEYGLEALARRHKNADPIGRSISSLAKQVGTLYQGGTIDLASFALRNPVETQAINAHYGSLKGAVSRALDDKLATATRQMRSVISDKQAVAAYQFYALLAAMRNARSHFRCRPVQHDGQLELSASWVWSFFVGGLRILATGQSPIHAPANAAFNNLRKAGAGRWLPTSNFLDDSDGDEFCARVISRFGHLIRLGILDVVPDLRSLGDHASELALKFPQG
jgi:hypothetical protein